MKKWLHTFVKNRLEMLRVCTLMVLLSTAACMLWPMETAVELQAVGKRAAKGALSGMRVTLDPGHGGYDGGARARDSGLWEKELTLKIALETEKALVERGAEVTLTRREDVCLCEGNTATKQRKRQDLQARVDTALLSDADVLLSIHLNEYRSRSQSGPQVFYQRGGEAGKVLAQALQQALVDGLEPKKVRVAMAGDYYVLRSRLPSALVECGFLSNAEEEKLLLTQGYHQKIAQSIADGLCAYRAQLSQSADP